VWKEQHIRSDPLREAMADGGDKTIVFGGKRLSSRRGAVPPSNIRLRLPARFGFYNASMPLIDQIQKDIVAAMKSREEERLSCLRMVKTALKHKEIEKMAPLDEKESQQVLSTLIKQRKESIEQFTKGGRTEMADKEAAEIKLIETYLPKEASEEEIVAGVRATMVDLTGPLTMKDLGSVMKAAMARFAAAGLRVDGKVVSEAVKKELAGK
jgi:uncharacterized protein